MKKSHKKGVKVWTKAELVQENLDFSFTDRLKRPEVMAVWYWELDRELGTVIEPFVHKPKPPAASAVSDFVRIRTAEGPNHEVAIPLGLKYHKLSSLLPRIKPSTDSLRVRGVSSRSRIHAFEINWDMPWPQVVAAFKAWGEQQSYYAKKSRAFGELGESVLLAWQPFRWGAGMVLG